MNSVEQFAAGVGTEVAEAADMPRLSLLVPPADRWLRRIRKSGKFKRPFSSFLAWFRAWTCAAEPARVRFELSESGRGANFALPMIEVSFEELAAAGQNAAGGPSSTFLNFGFAH